VRDHRTSFSREPKEAYDEPVPPFVEREMRRNPASGEFTRGFVHLRRTCCGSDVLVPFSCKTRPLFPICAQRRMLVQAAHLVDALAGAVLLRHDVLSFPFELSLLAACSWTPLWRVW